MTAHCKFVNYINREGGLYLGPLGEKHEFVQMFKILIPEDEARLGMFVPKIPTKAETIAEKAGLPVDKVSPMLKHMSQKGVIFEREVKGTFFYNITPFIPGFYEYVMTDPETRKDPRMAELFTGIIYGMGGLMREVSGQDGGLMKVTPVMQEIKAQKSVFTFEDVMSFIESATDYSVADCACRLSMKLLGKGCEHPIEDTCMQFNETADYYVRTGRGRRITKEEAIDILRKCEEAGLVHTAFTVEGGDNTSFVCNCCGCSCSGLRFTNTFDGNAFSRSNFRAEVNAESCVACGECVKICPVNAVTLGSSFCKDDSCQTPVYKQAAEHWMKKEDARMDFINERKISAALGTSPCKTICPAHISVQGYIANASKGKYREALEIIKRENPLPAVCGRICPHPCEAECTRGSVDDPIAIDAIKMFIADQELEAKNRFVPEKKHDYEEKVAVVGSGPAGLSCAYYLAEYGYKVTVFEKEHQPGGMLTMGIPAFRLEKDVVNAEIDILRELGVEFRYGVTVGTDVSIPTLREQGYKAFYLALGASKGVSIGCPGDALPGVYTGVDFLKAVNTGHAPEIGKSVAVIGGGNVAIDVARTAVRLGADAVTILYRRTREEMPANPDEIQEADEEGVKFKFLCAPAEITGDEKAERLRLEVMEPGEVDADGRRAIIGTGRYEEMNVDAVIAAVGQQIDLCHITDGTAIRIGKRNTVLVDDLSWQTEEPDVFAGGDLVTGPKFAIDAIAAGKQGAISINRLLRGLNMKNARNGQYTALDRHSVCIEGYDDMPRQKTGSVEPEKAVKTFRDLRGGLSEEQIRKETERCLHCGKSVVDTAKCIGCGVCTLQCHFDAIHLTRVAESTPAGSFGNWYKRIFKYAVKRAGKATINGLKG